MPESLLINRRDLDFQLFEVLQAEALAQRPRHADHSRETFTAALDQALADPQVLAIVLKGSTRAFSGGGGQGAAGLFEVC